MNLSHLWKKLFPPPPVQERDDTYGDYWLVLGKSKDQLYASFDLNYLPGDYDTDFRLICMDILSDFLQPYFCYTYYPKVNEPKFSQDANWIQADHIVVNHEKTLITAQYGIDVACITRFFGQRTDDFLGGWVDLYAYQQPLPVLPPVDRKHLETMYPPLCCVAYQELDDQIYLGVPLEQEDNVLKLIQSILEKYGKVLHICPD